MARIFISYRRSDSRKWANKLFEHISMRFGKDLVFQDVDDIKPGKDFLLVLHEAIKGCKVALILIGVLVMASRRKALVQMVGLFASENGIFFTAMAISQGMPLIIEIGVILDVVLGALVMGILVLRVRSSVDTDIADLESLKG